MKDGRIRKKKDLNCQFEDSIMMGRLSLGRVKRVCFKTLVDEVQELEALSKDPGAVVHGKRYCLEPLYSHSFRFSFFTLLSEPECLKGMLKDVMKCFYLLLFFQ